MRETIEALSKLNDPAVVVDILGVLVDKPNLFNLDMCCAMLPLLNDLLKGQFEEYVRDKR